MTSEREIAAAWLDEYKRTATPKQLERLKDMEAMGKAVAPVIQTLIAESIQSLADVIVAQGKTVTAQAERIALLEREAGYETIGTDKTGKPRLRAIARRAA